MMNASEFALPPSARAAARILRAWTRRDRTHLEADLIEVRRSARAPAPAGEAERLELLEAVAGEICGRDMPAARSAHLALLAHLAAPCAPSFP